MRIAARGERERAAFELATAYASPSPARTATSSGGWATCRRPMSTKSTASNRHVATGGRTSPARSRRGWEGQADEQLSLGLDFRRRRAVLMSRPRGPACETRGGGAVNDLEALDDQNQQLKVALSRLAEENKRYRVNKARLEGELLRADAKVEILLSELEQAPGKRDERVLNAARIEVEKCAVVRSLAKQKEHLQKMLARQERELDAMKQTKEWSAVVEMTAATEEYFLEVRRLQRLLAQQQQGASTNDPIAGVGDEEGGAEREAYVPSQRDPTQRRNSGVDDTVWIHRPESCDVSMPIPSPVDGMQAAFTSGVGDVYNAVHRSTSAPPVQANEFHVAHQEDNDAPLHEWGVPAFRRRPASPKRRASPPRRARMATRAGRETFGNGIHKKVSEEPRVSRQNTQVARGAFGRKQREASQSQAWIRAEEARTSVNGADARRSTVGARSRPVSAPRTKRELKMTSTGDARGADSLSPFDKGRQRKASSDRVAAARSGGGRNAASVRQKTTPRSSSSSRAPTDHIIPTVPVPTEPRNWEAGEKRQPKARSRSASPRSSFSRNRTGAGDTFRAQDENTTRTESAPGSTHQTIGRKGDHDGGSNIGEGGSDIGLPGVAGAPQTSRSVGDEVEPPPPFRDGNGTSDNVYHADDKRRPSLSVPSTESLAAAASVEHRSATVAKECEEGAIATTQGQEGHREQTADDGTPNPAGSEDAESASKDKDSRAAGDELARDLIGSGPSSWGSFEAVDEPPKNEATQGNTEEGSEKPVSSPTSADVDSREHPNAEVMTGVNGITSTSNIKGDDGGEKQAAAAAKTGGVTSDASLRSDSSGSPTDGDRNRSWSLPEVGDNTITRSVSSHTVTEKDPEGQDEVDAELETNKLLFDIGDDGDSAVDDPLVGENEAAPSEYGDDFDDFEDED